MYTSHNSQSAHACYLDFRNRCLPPLWQNQRTKPKKKSKSRKSSARGTNAPISQDHILKLEEEREAIFVTLFHETG